MCMRVLFLHTLKTIYEFDFDIFEGINDFDFAVERVSLAILGDRTVFGINLDIVSACSKGEKEAERESEKVLHNTGVLIQKTSNKFCAKRNRFKKGTSLSPKRNK